MSKCSRQRRPGFRPHARARRCIEEERSQAIGESLDISRAGQQPGRPVHDDLREPGDRVRSDGKPCEARLDGDPRHAFHPVGTTRHQHDVACREEVGDVASTSQERHPLTDAASRRPPLRLLPQGSVADEHVDGVAVVGEHPSPDLDVCERILLPGQRANGQHDGRRWPDPEGSPHRLAPDGGLQPLRVDRVRDGHHVPRRDAEEVDRFGTDRIRDRHDASGPSHQRSVRQPLGSVADPSRRHPDPAVHDRDPPPPRGEHGMLERFTPVCLHHVGLPARDHLRERPDRGDTDVESGDTARRGRRGGRSDPPRRRRPSARTSAVPDRAHRERRSDRRRRSRLLVVVSWRAREGHASVDVASLSVRSWSPRCA